MPTMPVEAVAAEGSGGGAGQTSHAHSRSAARSLSGSPLRVETSVRVLPCVMRQESGRPTDWPGRFHVEHAYRHTGSESRTQVALRPPIGCEVPSSCHPATLRRLLRPVDGNRGIVQRRKRPPGSPAKRGSTGGGRQRRAPSGERRPWRSPSPGTQDTRTQDTAHRSRHEGVCRSVLRDACRTPHAPACLVTVVRDRSPRPARAPGSWLRDLKASRPPSFRAERARLPRTPCGPAPRVATHPYISSARYAFQPGRLKPPT